MKRILALFAVLVFVGFGSGCSGSQSASSHDFIDLETNYNFSDVAASLYRYLKENNEYGHDDNDPYIGYLCDEETDWEAIFFSVSVFCADISCPLRGLALMDVLNIVKNSYNVLLEGNVRFIIIDFNSLQLSFFA